MRIEKLNSQQLDQFENMENEESFEAGEDKPCVPESNYCVQCIGYEKSNYHGAQKIKLNNKIMPPSEYAGTVIPMYMNKYGKFSFNTKYYKAWVIANWNKKPAREGRMSPDIFKDGVFEAVIITVKSKFPDGTDAPDCFNYSKVDFFRKRIE